MELSPVDEHIDSKIEEPKREVPGSLIRHDLVSTAVNFLLNPRVRNNSVADKRHFLLRKGLTNHEMDLALEYAEKGRPYVYVRSFDPQGKSTSNPFPTHIHQQVHYDYCLPGPFMMTRALIPPLMLISGVAYGLFLFYKRYVEPKLFGQQQHPYVIIQEQLSHLSSIIGTFNQSLVEMESRILEKLKVDLDKLAKPSAEEVAAWTEIKKELSSIKSLLLGRKQFPEVSIPTHQASIPAWQLTDDVKERQ